MIQSLIVFVLAAFTVADDAGWSNAVVVRQGADQIVRFQARVDGGYLLVRAMHEEGWHTYAMDNELRAVESLRGKMSLGIEQGIEITVAGGLELEGHWLQTAPRDLSRPELRWFTYGFDQTAFFARRVKNLTADPVVLRVKGQACSGETCCQIDVELHLQDVKPSAVELAQGNDGALKAWLDRLVPVKTKRRDAKDSHHD